MHLLELRRRALLILTWFGILFLFFFLFSKELFHILISPLVSSLPEQSNLIATQVTSTVFTPLKLAANAALLFTAPFGLQQFWCFIRPGLYYKEQKQLRGIMIFSLSLFTLGVLFCFYLVLPFMFQFFVSALPEGVRLLPDMSNALDFTSRMLLLFGLCFQVPLVCVILVHVQFIKVSTLKVIRPYIIVGAFILGMLLTPPDVFSQIMLAIPLCLLYEMGIILSMMYNLDTNEDSKALIMNREKEVEAIYHRKISKEEKIRLLEDIALDLHNEMEAQDQNMHPEIHNKLSEGLRLATNYIRELRNPK